MLSNKYYVSAISSIKEQITQRSVLIGKIFVFSIVLYIFKQIFEEIPNSTARITYVAITQLIIFSLPTLSSRLEEDIQNGNFTYFLFKPCHYLLLRLCESLGVFLLRFSILFPVALILIYMFTDTIIIKLDQTLLFFLFVLAAFFIFSLMQMLIGLLSFWLRDTTPVLYLSQTATFCFGGLIIPITFYPVFWQKLSFITPYPWILWWPAHVFYSTIDQISLLQASGAILLWLLFLSACIWGIYNLAMNKQLKSGVA